MRVPKIVNTVVDRVVRHSMETVEVVKPTVVHKVVQRKKPVVQERQQRCMGSRLGPALWEWPSRAPNCAMPPSLRAAAQRQL